MILFSCHSIPAAAGVLSVFLLGPKQQFTLAQKLNGNSCHIVTLLPFTDERPPIPEAHADPQINYGYGEWPDATTLAKASFSLLAAAEMARKHFNERDISIVPELAGLGDCDIQLENGYGNSSWVFDSGYTRGKAVDHLLPLTASPDVSEKICAVVGPVEPRAHEGVSVLTESLSVPQLAFATIDRRLERVADFPTFLRVIPSATDFAAKLALLAGRDIWKRDYIAVIYDDSDYGEQFEDPMEDAEDDLGYSTITEHIIEGDDESIYSSLGEAKEKGFRTILLSTNRPAFLNDVARIADDLGILGDSDYLWIISGAAFPTAMRDIMKYEVDSPTDKLLRSSAMYTNSDPFIYNGASDPFIKAWREQNASLANHVLDLVPLDEERHKFFTPDDTATYFQDETPAEYASFMYDSIIATGIGACQGLARTEPDAHYQAIIDTVFQGASGNFNIYSNGQYGEEPNTRDPAGAQFGVYNILPGEVVDGIRSYETVLTSIWNSSYTTNAFGEDYEGGVWSNVGDTEFLYYDGTTEEPMPLRDVADANMRSNGMQIAILTLSSVAIFLCIATGIFVIVKKKHKHIRSAQPEFLLMLCFGATLVAASIIFVSFDESDGLSEKQLSSLCTTFPWFAVVGYLIMFCALFSRLWRLDKVLTPTVKRQNVTVQQVMAPFTFIIVSSIIVLSVWTIIDPLVWVREPVSGFDEEGEKNPDAPLETYGQCSSVNYGILPFIVPLGFLFALVIGLTAVFSWRLKETSTDFNDSKLTFVGIFTHIEIWLLGIPILVITNSVSSDGFHLMIAALCFVFSISMIALVIWPKIYFYLRDTYFGGPKRTPIGQLQATTQVHISGLDSNPEAKRIRELELQVTTLKSELDKKESEVIAMSSRALLNVSENSESDVGGADPSSTAGKNEEA